MSLYQFSETIDPCEHTFDQKNINTFTDTPVYKSTCAYCPRSDAHGLFVSLWTFDAVCEIHLQKCVALNPGKPLFLWLLRAFVSNHEDPHAAQDAVNNAIAKVARDSEGNLIQKLVCTTCSKILPEGSGCTEIPIIHISGSVSPHLSDVARNAGWENTQGLIACPHTGKSLVIIPQHSPVRRFGPGNPPSSQAQCTSTHPGFGEGNASESVAVSSCGIALNNWFCLTCGTVNCPRVEAGGKGHGQLHFNLTGHPLALKLGTVTRDCRADLHCYACDEEVHDPMLGDHLLAFGIDCRTAVKTAKTLQEMSIERSLSFQYTRITGEEFKPIHGPGLTGLRNFGNSCYISSVIQVLFSLPQLAGRYFMIDGRAAIFHQQTCTNPSPRTCPDCVIEKVARGLLSGEFSTAFTEGNEGEDNATRKQLWENKQGFEPVDWKVLFAQGSADFEGNEQQDAEEYLRHVLDRFIWFSAGSPSNIAVAVPGTDPLTKASYFITENRLECSACFHVSFQFHATSILQLSLFETLQSFGMLARAQEWQRQKTSNNPSDNKAPELCVPVSQLLQCALGTEVIDSVHCDMCQQQSKRLVSNRIRTLPDVLFINVRRQFFDVTTLDSGKLVTPVEMPEELVIPPELCSMLDVTVPIEAFSYPPTKIQTQISKDQVMPDNAMVQSLLEMGIELDQARTALSISNNSIEQAMDLIFSGNLAVMMDNGIRAPQAIGGLQEVTMQREPNPKLSDFIQRPSPKYHLRCLISHIGQSANVGHYIAHIRHTFPDGSTHWVMFNDEKVGLCEKPPIDMATIYVYDRICEDSLP